MTDVLLDGIDGLDPLCSVCTGRRGSPVFVCTHCGRKGEVTSYCHRCLQRFTFTREQLEELFPGSLTHPAVIKGGLILSFFEEGGCPGCETSTDWSGMRYRSFSLLPREDDR